MRMLVTGAAGFLGSHLVDGLIAEGHDVAGVDSFTTGSATNLAHLRREPRFTFIEHDVVQPLAPAACGKPDWILHFASPASPPKYLARAVETLRVNAEGTFHLLEMALQTGARFLLASTSEVYGDPLVSPQPEGYAGNVNPIGPRSVYDEGKRYAEALTMAYLRTRGVDTRIIRIFNTYGPRLDPGDGRVVSNFITQALHGKPLTVYGDGNQTRSFQYVDDLMDGIVRLLAVQYHAPVNLGNPEEYTMLALAGMVNELTASTSPIVFEPLPEDDPKQRRPDIALAGRLLGWSPRVPVRQGLARTIAFYRTAPTGERR